jgi:hypothetical protein
LHAGDEDFNFWIFGAGLGDDSERFFLVSPGGIPRRPSLPPRAMTRTSAPLAMAQLTRRRPPAVVSPLTPALATV